MNVKRYLCIGSLEHVRSPPVIRSEGAVISITMGLRREIIWFRPLKAGTSAAQSSPKERNWGVGLCDIGRTEG